MRGGSAWQRGSISGTSFDGRLWFLFLSGPQGGAGATGASGTARPARHQGGQGTTWPGKKPGKEALRHGGGGREPRSFPSSPISGETAPQGVPRGEAAAGAACGRGPGAGVKGPGEESSPSPEPRSLQGSPGKTGPRGGVVSTGAPRPEVGPGGGVPASAQSPGSPFAGRPGRGRPPGRERREGERAAWGRPGEQGDPGRPDLVTARPCVCRASLASRGPRDR